jgi:predicted TIM-barrel fold metal-dependent hydrolase
MYEKDGEQYYIVDSHIAFWDARPENRNKFGEGFIKCFYDYHRNLSPKEYLWPFDEKFVKYTEEDLMHDIFEVGYADHAIFQPVYLGDFYTNGFHTPEMVAPIVERHPGLLSFNGTFDPRLGKKDLARLEALREQYGIKGVKLYTAEWKGDSRGWKLDSPEASRCLEKCQELGIKNIHVHKGPTVWPLDRDAFDVRDVDGAASNFPELNFIVEHVGLPRLEDFCWIATQEPNVYAGLAVAIPLIHTRPRYFGQIIGELLYWLNEDRILFSSDYAIWQPKWLVEKFVDFQIPEDMQSELGVLTTDVKKKILGLNAAALYDLEVPAWAGVVTDNEEDMAVGSEPLSPA